MKAFFLGFQKGFKQFTEVVTFVINTVLLTIVYFLGVGPVALISKLKRKNYMDLNVDADKKSYWLEHDDSSSPYRMW